jgi:predicted ATPase
MELEVEVENFGPISSGRVRLKPLTIFIGPNNSGKSYTAMLIR